MPAFYYEASNQAGKISTDVIEADSIKHARNLLREKGLIVLELHNNVERNKRIYFKPKVKYGIIIEFTRQFAVLLNAGLSIEQGLSLLIKEQDSPNFSNTLSQIKSDINEGKSLSQAMLSHKQIFPNLYVALIQAGEESGKLDLILSELADYLEKQQTIKEKVQNAFIYPAILTTISFGIIIFLMTYIIPKVVNIFDNKQQQLPLLTNIMLAISNALKNYWLYFIIFFVAIILFIKYLTTKQIIQYKLDKLMLGLPISKKISINYNSTLFSNTMSILTKAGIPILQALKTSANILSNLVLKQQVEQAAQSVKQGSSLSNALKDSNFPSIMLHLIKTGESTGKLSEALAKIAIHQTNSLNRFILFLTTLLEPMLILFMGCIIMLIVLAVLMPIMQLNQIV